ncbi:filamentation induced by cAMP protein Fic, partial [mine drainage metagenome]
MKPGDTLGKTVFGRYLTDFSWASSRMEGNTYTLLETRDMALFGVEAPGKSALESAMVKNHIRAIEYLVDNARSIEISPFEVRGFHALLSRGIVGNCENEGRVRRSVVEIGQSAYRPASSPHTLEDGLESICRTASRIGDPYEQSLYLLANLSYLQPFVDVNKRTARVFS